MRVVMATESMSRCRRHRLRRSRSPRSKYCRITSVELRTRNRGGPASHVRLWVMDRIPIDVRRPPWFPFSKMVYLWPS